jgi:hypothetical protein
MDASMFPKVQHNGQAQGPDVYNQQQRQLNVVPSQVAPVLTGLHMKPILELLIDM